VLPHLALLPQLKKHFAKIYYIGSTNASEQRIIENAGIPFYPLECVKLRRGLNPRSIMRNLGIPLGYIKSKKRAGELLDQLKPDIVFSKGGFVALPVVRACKARKIPVVAHESDATLGLANRLSLGCCEKICTTFCMCDQVKTTPKFIHTGSLIRPQIFHGNREVVVRRHILPDKRNLLILGGSLGAANINAVVREARTLLEKNYNIIHVCGRGKKINASELEFIDDIENYLAWADVVVSRAGSNTLCELMVLGKPTLFIPLASGRGDQIDNAREVAKHRAAGVLHEQSLNVETFVAALGDVWNNRETYARNSRDVVKDGTKQVFDTIYSVVRDK